MLYATSAANRVANAVLNFGEYVSGSSFWYVYLTAKSSASDKMRVPSSLTRALELFLKIQNKNKNAKCICIDIAPYDNTQLKENNSILNIGGFSDKVFDVIGSFCNGNGDHWVDAIERMDV